MPPCFALPSYQAFRLGSISTGHVNYCQVRSGSAENQVSPTAPCWYSIHTHVLLNIYEVFRRNEPPFKYLMWWADEVSILFDICWCVENMSSCQHGKTCKYMYIDRESQSKSHICHKSPGNRIPSKYLSFYCNQRSANGWMYRTNSSGVTK